MKTSEKSLFLCKIENTSNNNAIRITSTLICSSERCNKRYYRKWFNFLLPNYFSHTIKLELTSLYQRVIYVKYKPLLFIRL
jgi:hypothetical protein